MGHCPPNLLSGEKTVTNRAAQGSNDNKSRERIISGHCPPYFLSGEKTVTNRAAQGSNDNKKPSTNCLRALPAKKACCKTQHAFCL